MSSPVVAFGVAVVAGYGTLLLYTSLALGWRGLSLAPGLTRAVRARRLHDVLVQAGIDRTRLAELAAVATVLAIAAAAAGHVVYGSWIASAVLGAAAAMVPVASARGRRRRHRELARESWPRMIEEIRLQAVGLGRPIPQALVDVGLRGPEELRPAFAAAQREWLISTDADRMLDVLKSQLADPTADTVCETLLVAHEVGGTDVDGRLSALAEDRLQDLRSRKDAFAKHAGARFGRIFVLLVPFGMALVGLSIGDGRRAFQTPSGQAGVLVAFALMALCWWWAGRLLRLPEERRVFAEREGDT